MTRRTWRYLRWGVWCMIVHAVAAELPPVITLQPQSQTIPLGGTAVFSVEATNGTALTYAWYFQGAAIAGATSSTCIISNAQFTNAGTYYAVVHNVGGWVNSSNAVLAIKNAPILSGANNFIPVYQNDFTNAGTRVSSLIANKVIDPDPGAVQGIAVVAADNVNGTWEFSTDGGLSWSAFGSPTENAARLLAANRNTFARFVPNPNWFGTVTNGFTFRAWDQTAGVAGGTADVTVNGGTTAFSTAQAATSISVVNFNFLLVDTTSDLLDGTTSSIGALLANRGSDGRISLREAITAANNTANAPGGLDHILFAVPDPLVDGAHTIIVTSALPAVTDSVVIDGATDAVTPTFGPVIQLDGTAAGVGVSGLTLQADGSTVRGLAINRFSANGLVLNGHSNTATMLCVGVGVGGLSALGNGDAGILITGAKNSIGGDGYYEYNLIGGNQGPGIKISRATATGNLLRNNYIGLGFDSLTLLTNGQGVRIESGASGNRVGTAGQGLANQIAGSVGAGISVFGPSTTNNALLGNVIRANGGLAIDLNDDGVTANDAGDGDTGPNRRQNFPVLAAATVAGLSLTVAGSLNSAPNTPYRLEFFRVLSGHADATGHGEAGAYLGQVGVTTSATGDTIFNVTISGVVLAAGDMITATATRDFGAGVYGDTSECARNISAVFVGTPGFEISGLSPRPLGNAIRANTTTAGDQWNYYWSIRTVAVAPDGSFVKVWIDKGGLDGSQSGIFGQRFDPNGNRLGGEFLVNTTTLGSQENGSVAIDRSGGFVVCWDSGGDIYGQRYLANGTPLGGEFMVNTTTSGTQRYPEVDFAPDGTFLIAWTGPNPSGGGSATLFQRYAANGSKLGGEIVGHVFSGTSQILDSLSIRGDGSLVIAWGGTGDIYGRLFGPDGVPTTAPLLLNATTAGTQQYSVVRADRAGNFVAVWESLSQDGSGNGIFGRRFDVSGTPLGGEFAVTSQTAGDQYGPAITMDQFGNFAVAWTDGNALDGSAESVWLQRFAATGQRVGPAVQVNQTTAGYQGYPVIAMNDVGRVVVGWEGIGPGDNYGVYVRRYQLDPVVSEGSNTTFTVTLNTPPTAPVTLNLSVSDPTEASLSVSALTFLPTDWSLPQTVTLSGVQDRILDGDVALIIATAPAASADPSYNHLNPEDIPAIVQDSGVLNTLPVANPQSVTTPEATPKTIVLSGSDADNDALAFAIVAPPAHGVLSGPDPKTGVLVYTPKDGFSGRDSFSFGVSDGFANSSPATVDISVNPVLTGQWIPGGGFQVELSTVPGATVDILASTNLVDWLILVTTNASSGLIQVIDRDVAHYPQRFYRSRVAP